MEQELKEGHVAELVEVCPLGCHGPGSYEVHTGARRYTRVARAVSPSCSRARGGSSPFILPKHEGNSRLTFLLVDVVLVRWPKETDHRDRLARDRSAAAAARGGGVQPAAVEDPLEDWVRVPRADTDVAGPARHARAAGPAPGPALPTLDDDGVIRHNGPVGVAATGRGAASPGCCSTARRRRESRRPRRAGWPEGAPGRNALDVHVLRLRRRARAGRSGHPHRALARLPARGRPSRVAREA